MLIGATEPDTMTPAQKAVHAAIASGPRGGVPKPFLAMLDAPELAEAIQGVGAALRFSGALPDGLREVAILSAAAAFGSGYEWNYHEPIARRLGVSDAAIEAARTGRTDGVEAEPLAAAVVGFCHAAVTRRTASHADLARIGEQLGRSAATEVVAIAGYYPLLALFLTTAGLDEPLPS